MKCFGEYTKFVKKEHTNAHYQTGTDNKKTSEFRTAIKDIYYNYEGNLHELEDEKKTLAKNQKCGKSAAEEI